MKWNFASYVAAGAVIALGTASGLNGLAQQNGPNGRERPNNPVVTPPNSGVPGQAGPGGGFLGQSDIFVPVTSQSVGPDGQVVNTTEMRLVRGGHHPQRSPEHQQALRDAISKLRSTSSSEAEKKEAREAVMKYLKEEFERDQKGRREQLERLEEQVSKLRKQLEKREESQAKIIELRMQLLDNDAEGLSFPDSFNELQRFSGPGNPYNAFGPAEASQFQFQPMPYSVPPNIQRGTSGNPGSGQGPMPPNFQPYQPPQGFAPTFDSYPRVGGPGNQIPPSNPFGPNDTPKPRKPGKDKPEFEEKAD